MTVERRSLRDQIRDVLLERIANGQLQPGDRIIEARLAEEFQVSPIPIREAIRELMAMGILDFIAHKGAWVREVSLQETIEAMQVRAALDSLAAQLAAPRLAGRCGPLRKALSALVVAARARDFAAFQHHNQILHRAVIEAAENEVLLRVWEKLAFQVRTRFTMDFLASVDPMMLAQEHEPIVDALDQGDGRRAAKLLAAHSKHLVGYLRREASGTGKTETRKAAPVERAVR
ncbi:MAG: GntR family transcriptional regulator [Thermoguttaceae bacterium]|jgi:DNA-binding GntR family transcriptional regulator